MCAVRLFEVSEVKEDSLEVALAAFSTHVLQFTSVSFPSILYRNSDKCDGNNRDGPICTTSSEKGMNYKNKIECAYSSTQHQRSSARLPWHGSSAHMNHLRPNNASPSGRAMKQHRVHSINLIFCTTTVALHTQNKIMIKHTAFYEHENMKLELKLLIIHLHDPRQKSNNYNLVR